MECSRNKQTVKFTHILKPLSMRVTGDFVSLSLGGISVTAELP